MVTASPTRVTANPQAVKANLPRVTAKPHKVTASHRAVTASLLRSMVSPRGVTARATPSQASMQLKGKAVPNRASKAALGMSQALGAWVEDSRAPCRPLLRFQPRKRLLHCTIRLLL